MQPFEGPGSGEDAAVPETGREVERTVTGRTVAGSGVDDRAAVERSRAGFLRVKDRTGGECREVRGRDRAVVADSPEVVPAVLRQGAGIDRVVTPLPRL